MSPSKPLRLKISTEADRDLETIWRYSFEQWGVVQADRYTDALEDTFNTLCAMPQMARERRDVDPPVRVHPSAKHLIVFVTDDTTLTVVRVLSQRQNWQAILSN